MDKSTVTTQPSDNSSGRDGFTLKFAEQTGNARRVEDLHVKLMGLDKFRKGSWIWNVWERRTWIPWLEGKGTWIITVISYILDKRGVGGMGWTNNVIQREILMGMDPIRVKGNGFSMARGFKDRGIFWPGRNIRHEEIRALEIKEERDLDTRVGSDLT